MSSAWDESERMVCACVCKCVSVCACVFYIFVFMINGFVLFVNVLFVKGVCSVSVLWLMFQTMMLNIIYYYCISGLVRLWDLLPLTCWSRRE